MEKYDNEQVNHTWAFKTYRLNTLLASHLNKEMGLFEALFFCALSIKNLQLHNLMKFDNGIARALLAIAIPLFNFVSTLTWIL